MTTSLTPSFDFGPDGKRRSGPRGRPTAAETALLRNYLLTHFNAGRSVFELAAEVNRQPHTVIKALKAAGIPHNHPRLNERRPHGRRPVPHLINRIDAMAAAGEVPVKVMAAEVGRSVTQVRRILWAIGYRMMLVLPEERSHIMARRRASAAVRAQAA